MEKTWQGCDFSRVEKVRSADSASAFPINIYWMRATDSSDATAFQTPKGHRHSFFELHFVLRGSMKYEYDGCKVAVGWEQMLLLPPERVHRIAYYSEDVLKLSVAFSVDRDEELYAALCAKSGQAFALSEGARESLQLCGAEARKGTLYSPLILRGRIFEILYELAGVHEKQKRSEDESDIRLVKAKQFISDNAGTFLCCEDVAGYCYISVKQLNRIFLRYENMTLLAYIHREKLRAAETLLKERDRSIQEISETLGFSSVYYFHAFFSKYMGMTPGQYRKEILGTYD